MNAFYQDVLLEAGCDEAGRGCLAGPVVAAAVILPVGFDPPGLNDSKQLSARQRDALRLLIEREATAWAVARVEAAEIDQINILNASFLAMHRALERLHTTPELLLIDGNRFKTWRSVPHHCIVKGDSKYQSIAAASILAKTHRDELMSQLHHQFPQYQWNRNQGYPTVAHRNAIRENGVTVWHRRSFQLLPVPQLDLR
jgi:ribonuclease HII